MGYRHSSAQLSGHSGFSAADRRATRSSSTGIFAPTQSRQARTVATWGEHTLLFLLRCYMIFFSPFFGGACKFQPSCSNYAYEAILLHGAGRGFVLAMKRLLRCRPFTLGGFDPVPQPDARHRRREPVL